MHYHSGYVYGARRARKVSPGALGDGQAPFAQRAPALRHGTRSVVILSHDPRKEKNRAATPGPERLLCRVPTSMPSIKPPTSAAFAKKDPLGRKEPHARCTHVGGEACRTPRYTKTS